MPVPRRARASNNAPARLQPQLSVTPPLLALGLLLEGDTVDPAYVRESLKFGLLRADVVFNKRLKSKTAGLPDNLVADFTLHRVRLSEDYNVITDHGRNRHEPALMRIVEEVTGDALWLGIALSYRFFSFGGGAR
jgi:hypothetical protein